MHTSFLSLRMNEESQLQTRPQQRRDHYEQLGNVYDRMGTYETLGNVYDRICTYETVGNVYDNRLVPKL